MAQAAYPKALLQEILTVMSGQLIYDAFLFGLAPRGVYLAGHVTTTAGELLPHRFTHYPGSPGLDYSLLHLSFSRQLRRPGSYPARCPTVFGLSSFAEAKAITRRALLKAKKL